ncbi:ubiquitin carboxyl-terminal hydrolase CYLD isoform X2 [Centruroides vittatus]
MMNQEPMRKRRFILRADCFGKKIGNDFHTNSSRPSPIETEVQLPTGCILQEIRNDIAIKNKSALCLRSLDHDSVYLVCCGSEIEELTPFEADLLLSIIPFRERLKVFADNSALEQATLITEGSKVDVYLNDNLESVEGIVCYCGPVPELGKGIMFGVELLKHPELGVCDGSIKGQRYFQCSGNSGVFVAINRLRLHLCGYKHTSSSKLIDHLDSRLSSPNSGASGTTSKPQPIPLEAVCSAGTPPPPLKFGDRVVWISDTGPEYGEVRWLGKLPDVGSDWMVGVEFDNPVGTGTGKYNDYQLFEAKLNHASLVPIIGLMKADDFLGDKLQETSGTPPRPRRKKKISESQANERVEKYGLGEENSLPVISKCGSCLSAGSPRAVRKGLSVPNDISEISHLISYDSLLPSTPPSSESLPNYSNILLNENNISNSTPSVNPLYEMLSEKSKSTPKIGITRVDDTNSCSNVINASHQVKKGVKSSNETNSGKSEYSSDLEVGSVVEVAINGVPCYGVIKWIGRIGEGQNNNKLVAGIEMEEESSCCTDGTFGGKRYFTCPPRKAFFVHLNQCRKDGRFLDTERRKSAVFGSIDCPSVSGDVPPLCNPDDLKQLYGKSKGIQGHHNSCYLDATLFAMFSCTSVFDSLLHRPRNKDDIAEYDEVQCVLKEEIVNPLRANFYVRADRVMKLRKLLDKLSSVSGLTTEEKDPEEFLNSLLNQILKADPFLKLSSGQESYFYQLFVEKDDKLLLPTVQHLFDQSFLASDIKLQEVPSCLLIQMPRFGKQFKMYPRIIPSLYLDITDVLEDSPRQCTVCGQVAECECKECFGHFGDGLDTIAFCQKCMDKSHSHKKRLRHKSTKLKIPPEFKMLKDHMPVPRVYMELFAVVCIETSHYVCFVKCGSGPDAPWCFFDSMADRKGEQNGYNIPEVIPFPDLQWWLSEEGMNFLLLTKDDKVLPEIARRLLCDAYMCMYQSPDIMMYR